MNVKEHVLEMKYGFIAFHLTMHPSTIIIKIRDDVDFCESIASLQPKQEDQNFITEKFKTKEFQMVSLKLASNTDFTIIDPAEIDLDTMMRVVVATGGIIFIQEV